MSLDAIHAEVRALADPVRAAGVARFFKTGPGEYGEGDRFLGLTVPQIRRLARAHRALPLAGTLAVALALLASEWHEERLLALLLLADAHARAQDPAERRAIHDAYLARIGRVNNWDLVDASAPYIVGPHVAPDDLALLERLAASPSLWERRIAMVATQHHIRTGDVRPALHVAGRLLDDREDLLHKATGWMLREAWKRDPAAVEAFVRRHHARLPRTALRYAIERFPAARRRAWLAGPPRA
jgi:3-methyladenine DNA glycosylase AlkD